MKKKLLLLTLAMVLAMTVGSVSAATMSSSATAPTVNGEDVANYVDTGNLDKWFCISGEAASKVMGQTFTTPGSGVNLIAVTYQVADSQKAEPTKTYTIRVGTVSGTTFTAIYSETATQTFTWNYGEYMTWTFDTPVTLDADTLYAVDVGMNSSTSGWQTGIPYLQYSSSDQYADGSRYISGTGTPPGVGDTTMQSVSGDRVFHLDMYALDSDGDGLLDSVETDTGTYVSPTDTGTDPLDADTDGDGAGDWYEITASYTDPTDADDFPVIPYPLPDPDASYGNTVDPVRVYIMAGQSNMVGFGTVNGVLPGTLDTITKVDNKFPNLIDGSNNWITRNDVMYRGVISCIGDDYLKPRFGASSSYIGPEFGFGHVMGYYHDEPVLLIKSSIGNRSLSWDYAPPSTPRFDYNGYTYAGYGDSPNSWLIDSGPTPFVWYAGKQWDDCFVDEGDMGPTGWVNATTYPSGCQINNNGVIYSCKLAHTSSSTSEPGVGAQWSTYWNVYSVFNVTNILDNFATEYPDYADQGFEIAGYVWWQGHKDQSNPHAYRYELNMVNFINDIRDYYETRYPNNTVPDAPFVLATIGFDGGWDNTSTYFLAIANGQLAVSGETDNYPAFAGNVKTIEARGYWRDSSISPTATGYHYNHNAETQMLVGDALGRAMVELLTGIHEMEDGTMSGAVVSTVHAGYTGTGFADYTASTGYVELTVNVPTGGDYDLSYRYALASGNRPLEIKVNGQVVSSSLSFPATGSWTTWGYTATVPITLNAGNNTIRATGIGSSGANVDHLLIERY